MGYLKRNRLGRFKKKVVERVKEVIVWLVIAAVFALTALQYQTVRLLDRVLENQPESSEQAAEWAPEYDPCGLAVVDCAEAAEVSVNAEAEGLAEYLRSKGGHELAEYASDIVKLYRWQDAVAIAYKETHFCTKGVGASRNNCGGIKSWQTTNTFKTYENVYDSVWDISYLLNKPRFKGLTLAEMNGSYCVYEAGDGGECPNWTEVVTNIKAELTLATTVQ